MPRIPVSGGAQVAPTDTPQVRAPASAFGVPTVPDLRGVQQAVSVVDEHRQRMQDEQDQMVLNNAEVQIGNLRTELMTTATSAQGHNALGASQEVGPAWEQGVGEILKNLPNDRTKFLAQHRAAGYWANLNEAVQSHTAAQMRKQDVTDTNALIEQDTQAIATDPTTAPQIADRVRARLTDFAQRNGWSEAQRDVKIAEAVSDIHAAAIARWAEEATDESATIAQNYLDIYKDELVGAQRVQAEKMVDVALAQGRGFADADRILGINQTDVIPEQDPQQQQGPVSMESALARAERIPDARQRKAAIDQIVAHFSHLEQAKRIGRETALQSVTQEIERTGGRINRASKAWQLIDGTAQGEQALHRQEQILRPPKDPGNPDAFMHYASLNGLNPASTKEFLSLDIPSVAKTEGLSNGEALRLMSMQRVARGQEVRGGLTAAQRQVHAEDLRYRRETALLKAAEITDKAERDVEVGRIKRHFNQLQGTQPAPSMAGPTSSGDIDLRALVPVPEAWQARVLADPKYKKFLADGGYDVQSVKPVPEPKT